MSLRADVQNVFHNAETAQFEADVTLHIDGARATYAVSVLAPITAEFEEIRPALIRAAQARHGVEPPALSRRTHEAPAPDRTEEMLERILFAGPRYLDEIIARAA